MAAPFSRLQLAAALLEYDNDPENPDAPKRSAQESAIFLHVRRNARPAAATRKSSYLNVPLPSDGGSISGRESALDKRRSRASIDALRNMFPEDEAYEEETAEGAPLEVDLASWGLDAFMPKEKGSKTAKHKGKSRTLPPPEPIHSVSAAHVPQTETVRNAPPTRGTRSLSVGNYDHLEIPIDHVRRKSFGSPLDLDGVEVTDIPPRPPLNPALSSDLRVPQPQLVPFPMTSSRSPSPVPGAGHERTYSRASMDSRILLRDDEQVPRSLSRASMTLEDNPFALRPPSHASKFDPKAAAHARTTSNASMDSRMLLDDGMSMMTGVTGRPSLGDKRYSSTLELLRPKVLVMPSPLQPVSQQEHDFEPPSRAARDGFQVTTDGPPLPPGARSARQSYLEPSSQAPLASQSFTPNPKGVLSLSQLTFRSTLAVGGQREGAYSDLDTSIPRALEDGQQAGIEIDENLPPDAILVDDGAGPSRPAGKLYGKSLIDDLESRKAAMRGKQRVFRGDDRPSMMARSQTRSSTLIDPATLQSGNRMSSFDPTNGQSRRDSRQPLLKFDEEKKASPVLTPGGNMPTSRSVFGTDKLWEREMQKLKEMEAAEKLAAEQQGPAKPKHNKLRKGGRAALAPPTVIASPSQTSFASEEPAEPRVSIAPPVLPAIPRAVRGPPPPVGDDDDEESDSDASVVPQQTKADVTGWNAASDDDDGPRRTTGTGLRNPPRTEGSDEDVPLSVAVNRSLRPGARLKAEDDSDEDKPLSIMLGRSKSPLLPINFDSLSVSNPPNADDDDAPLGLRASRMMPQNRAGEDDDAPLALHPEQQRRAQYHMMAQFQQQQQQQQQMMLQAQMTSSMYFNPMMAYPQMPMGMPMQSPSPPPAHDANKYGSIDRWRHDVTLDGER